MKTIAFVIPWFGFDIPGGAEMELKGLVSHLHDAGVKVEILTTCVKEFTSSWSVNHYKQKAYVENGITVRYEQLKMHIKDIQKTALEKTSFILPFKQIGKLKEYLDDYTEKILRR